MMARCRQRTMRMEKKEQHFLLVYHLITSKILQIVLLIKIQ